jgi:hypothetical protein
MLWPLVGGRSFLHARIACVVTVCRHCLAFKLADGHVLSVLCWLTSSLSKDLILMNAAGKHKLQMAADV